MTNTTVVASSVIATAAALSACAPYDPNYHFIPQAVTQTTNLVAAPLTQARSTPLWNRSTGALQIVTDGEVSNACYPRDVYQTGLAGKDFPQQCSTAINVQNWYQAGFNAYCNAVPIEKLEADAANTGSVDRRCIYNSFQQQAINRGSKTYCNDFPVASFGIEGKSLPDSCNWSDQQLAAHKNAFERDFCRNEYARWDRRNAEIQAVSGRFGRSLDGKTIIVNGQNVTVNVPTAYQIDAACTDYLAPFMQGYRVRFL